MIELMLVSDSLLIFLLSDFFNSSVVGKFWLATERTPKEASWLSTCYFFRMPFPRACFVYMFGSLRGVDLFYWASESCSLSICSSSTPWDSGSISSSSISEDSPSSLSLNRSASLDSSWPSSNSSSLSKCLFSLDSPVFSSSSTSTSLRSPY